MIVYWLMFAVPALFALLEQPRDRPAPSPIWVVAAFVLAMLIGFRWNTGGDWMNYYRMVEDAAFATDPSGALSDPGFALIVKIAAGTSTGMLLVTVISGVLMGIGLTRFCLHQPRPWLCMAVSVPYLVIVMGMGYIRQGMAISCLMMGLVTLKDGRVVRYCLWVTFGALFHTTALILLPLGPLAVNRNPVLRAALSLATAVLLFYGLRSARAEELVTNYMTAEMSSSGAAIRLLMTALPSSVFLAFGQRFKLGKTENEVWKLLSLAGIASFLAFFISPSSTVIDRIALYLLPVQSCIYSRLPQAFARTRRNEAFLTVSIIILYTTALYVWLNYGVNSMSWIPYRFYFLEDDACLKC